MSKPSILLQLDTDPQPSVFDGVVAVDAGVDHLFRHGGVTPDKVRELVHGAMFTRGPDELHRTAIFVGGTDVEAAERVARSVSECFFGPLRVSLMLDPNGANTTAAAAVLAAGRHVELGGATALVLAATGPVGQRVVRLLARQGTRVRAASRNLERAQRVCDDVARLVEGASLEPHETSSAGGLSASLEGVELIVAAGAPGVQLLGREARVGCPTLQVAVDLSAVPPLGLEGIEVVDKAQERDGALAYGAIGVGGTKMKIHKEALRKLFEANDLVLDAEEIYELGRAMS